MKLYNNNPCYCIGTFTTMLTISSLVTYTLFPKILELYKTKNNIYINISLIAISGFFAFSSVLLFVQAHKKSIKNLNSRIESLNSDTRVYCVGLMADPKGPDSQLRKGITGDIGGEITKLTKENKLLLGSLLLLDSLEEIGHKHSQQVTQRLAKLQTLLKINQGNIEKYLEELRKSLLNLNETLFNMLETALERIPERKSSVVAIPSEQIWVPQEQAPSEAEKDPSTQLSTSRLSIPVTAVRQKPTTLVQNAKAVFSIFGKGKSSTKTSHRELTDDEAQTYERGSGTTTLGRF